MFKQYLIKYKYNIEFHKSCCFTWSTKNIHRYLIKIEIQINVKLQLSENKQKINMIVCTAYTHFQNWSTKQTTGAQSPHLIDFFTITSKFSLHPNPTTTTATSSSPPNFSINQKITSPVGPHPLFLSHTLTHHTRTYIYMQETWKTCFSPMTQACSRQAVRLLSLSLFLGAPHPQFLSPHHKRRALLPSPPLRVHPRGGSACARSLSGIPTTAGGARRPCSAHSASSAAGARVVPVIQYTVVCLSRRTITPPPPPSCNSFCSPGASSSAAAAAAWNFRFLHRRCSVYRKKTKKKVVSVRVSQGLRACVL